MSTAAVKEICTIIAKGQTTVPKVIRQALGVGYGGRIASRVEHGSVTVHAVSDESEGCDPALAPFLDLIERDLAVRPIEAVRTLDQAHLDRLEPLVAEIGKVDPALPIDGDVSL